MVKNWIKFALFTSLNCFASTGDLSSSHMVTKLLSLYGGSEAEGVVIHGHTNSGKLCDFVARNTNVGSEFWIRPTDQSNQCMDVNRPNSDCRMAGTPDRVLFVDGKDRWNYGFDPLFPSLSITMFIQKSNFDIPLSATFTGFDDVPEYTCYFEIQGT